MSNSILRIGRATLICLLLLGLGCSGPGPVAQDVADVGADVAGADTDVGPTTGLSFSDEAKEIWSEKLLDGLVLWVDASAGIAVALSLEGLWVIEGDDVWAVDVPEELEMLVYEAVEVLPSGEILLGAQEGLFVIQDGALSASPIGELLGDQVIVDLALETSDAGPVLTIATATGLHRWSQGSLVFLEPEGLATSSARLAVSGEGVWVAAGSDLYRLVEGDGGLEAWPEREGTAILDVQEDKHGRVWLRTQEGLELRWVSGQWEVLDAQLGAEDVRVSLGSEGAWIWAKGSLWHETDGVVRPTEAALDAQAWAADNEGRLLAAKDDGLWRLNAGKSVNLVGWQEEGFLFGPTTLTVEMEAAESVESIEVSVGGVEISSNEDFQFELDPEALGKGSAEILINIHLKGSEVPTKAVFPFEVVVLSWDADVFPIFDEHCGGCHGETGNVSLKLYTAELWEVSYEKVLPAVETGFMPPPYVITDAEIQTIRHWGFCAYPP